MSLYYKNFSVLLEANKKSIKIDSDENIDYDNVEDEQSDDDINNDDSEGMDDSTDYTSDTDDDSSSFDDSSNSTSTDNDGYSSSNSGDDGSLSSESIDDKSEVEKNALIMSDFQNLYYFIKNILEKVSVTDKGNMLVNTIISQVANNLSLLQAKLYNYIVNNFSKKYISNLYQYNFFIEALKINIEMLKKIKDFDIN